MYCHVCGTKSSPGDVACGKCKTKLISASTTEEQIWAETAVGLEMGAESAPLLSRQQSAPQQSGGGIGRAWSILVPLLLAAIVGALLTYYYNQESAVNDEVLTLHEQAEKAALEGKYAEALKLLDAALEKRPNVEALTEDRQIAAKAFNQMNQLKQAAESLKTGKLSEASKTLQAVAKALKEREEPAFDNVRSELGKQQVTLSVLKVKKEIDGLTTVSALAEKLETVSALKGKEAQAVQKQIIDKLASISYQDAEQLVKKKDFTAALQTVDQGLSYAPENEKLTEYRERVLSEKKAFEEAEAERIRLAEQQAAEEDLKNRTAAVSVLDLQAELDEYGDLYIGGTVVNNATRPIWSVALTIDIYSTDGYYIGQTEAYVYPGTLAASEQGSFETYYYGVYQSANVSVSGATWYLE
ncbi:MULTISPECIES: FxLYD domain-containing protein [Paenibacillus]|uniref:FxLYD domain-containing protein n=1 Tax=Paenibacillus TaxID=44249 RepID=UPI001F2BABA4|nr:FxLYD domain-containing protein [Paenibacillus sp. JJ-223]CAH1222183.1 hypothetical protein PAECIP111890_05359 [Paenibacillus sp. JJ-223]